MKELKCLWEYGESKFQIFYEATVGKDYLLVFQNKFDDNNLWMASINGKMILDKAFNDRQRKKEGIDKSDSDLKPRCIGILGSIDPEYMKLKVEWCYRNNSLEVCK